MAKKYQIVLLCFLVFQVFYGQRNNQQFRFTECASTPQCNLVFNGNFEEFDVLPDLLGLLENACNWINGFGAPDYYHSGVITPSSFVDIPGNNPVKPNPPVNPIFGGNAYAGFGTTVINQETGEWKSDLLAIKLVQSLQDNTNYVLQFDVVRSTHRTVNTSIQIQACLAENPLLPLSAGQGTFVLGSNDIVETSTAFIANTASATNPRGVWERLTFNFTTGNTFALDHLLIGGI